MAETLTDATSEIVTPGRKVYDLRVHEHEVVAMWVWSREEGITAAVFCHECRWVGEIWYRYQIELRA